MTVRAKFSCISITKYTYPGSTVTLIPVYDHTIPEDVRYAKATPSGTIQLMIDNPPAEEHFQLGQAYYVDFAKA